MKHYFPLAVSILISILSIACTPNAAATGSVADKAGLIAALESNSAQVSPGDMVEQPFFSVRGQFITVNDADIQVFEYQTQAAMEAEAATVSPDGSSIGTTMVEWVAPPHFYKSGPIIVLYLGDNPAVMGLLDRVLGPQFAGM